jgi:hypothetical protein
MLLQLPDQHIYLLTDNTDPNSPLQAIVRAPA